MDIVKHLAIFNPAKVEGPVAVIGVGAVGSAVALQLAKLGLKHTLFDHDVVEEHNIANQVLYQQKYDIGDYKARAASERLNDLTGLDIDNVVEKVSTKDQIRGFHTIFVCVDSMSERRKILDLTFCSGIKYFVEGRMGSRHGGAYIVQPDDPVQLGDYREELYGDEDVIVDRAACGTIQSIVSTAALTASYMVWLFISHIMGAEEGKVNEILFSVSPPLLTSRRFRKTCE